MAVHGTVSGAKFVSNPTRGPGDDLEAMKLGDLKHIVADEGLAVKINVGGASRRTKADIVADIHAARVNRLEAEDADACKDFDLTKKDARGNVLGRFVTCDDLAEGVHAEARSRHLDRFYTCEDLTGAVDVVDDGRTQKGDVHGLVTADDLACDADSQASTACLDHFTTCDDFDLAQKDGEFDHIQNNKDPEHGTSNAASKEDLDTLSLDELKRIIDFEGLSVTKNVGGPSRRTKAQIVTEVREARAQRVTLESLSLHELKRIIDAEGLDVAKNVGGHSRRTKVQLVSDIHAARASRRELESLSLDELKRIIDDEGLEVAKNVGGALRRSKEQICAEIRGARANRSQRQQ